MPSNGGRRPSSTRVEREHPWMADIKAAWRPQRRVLAGGKGRNSKTAELEIRGGPADAADARNSK